MLERYGYGETVGEDGQRTRVKEKGLEREKVRELERRLEKEGQRVKSLAKEGQIVIQAEGLKKETSTKKRGLNRKD